MFFSMHDAMTSCVIVGKAALKRHPNKHHGTPVFTQMHGQHH